jgi:hypothetical protein
MGDLIARIVENLVGRTGGPFSFRLILQPMFAIVLAVRAGVEDARADRPAYFWAVLTNPKARGELLREGWKAVATIFVLASLIDVVYQLLVFRWVYLGEMLIIAFLLACAPYLLVRGPINRIVAATRQRHQS